jgi:two-component system, CitB family, response regulator DctR
VNECITTLIVEDDPMVLEINRQFIERVEGFSVNGTAQNCAEAEKLLKVLKPQLVILDIYLPDASGVELLKKIRSMGFPVDVIMITAARDRSIIQDVLRYGAIDYIVKPFKFSRLQNSLLSYKILRNKLEKTGTLDQEEIDSLTNAATPSSSFENLPKGLNEITLRQVFLYIVKKKGALCAEEVAEGVGIARVTARRYLEYLDSKGIVQLELQYGSVGRPINRYSII